MKALIYLYLLKLKGSIRHVFSKVGSAIFAVVLILLYGGIFIGLLANGDQVISLYNIQSIHMAIFVGIAFTAFMVGVMLMQKNKALFLEEDAFYLFAGPFKRKHTMQYLISQSFVSALSCGAISLFIMVMFGASIQYKFLFLLLVFFAHALTCLFFTILYYYVYLLSIKDTKYKHISSIVIAIFVACVLMVYIAVIAQNDFSFTNSGMLFLSSDLFYFVPMFGWIKLVLVSYVMGNVPLLCLGMVLLCVACGIVYYLLLHYQGNFVEKAMQDAIEFTTKYKEVKAGNRTSMNEKKVRNIKGDFKEGAQAIYSKNMLLMKKSNAFIETSDLIFIGIYIAVSAFGDFGFMFFIYMMMFWLFSSIQNASFMKEMDHYQIYLIPANPFHKLLYLVKPYIMKYAVLVAVPILLGGLILRATPLEMLQNYILLAGYSCLFISASVLATRLLKSRNNNVMENLLRMFVILMASIPSIILIIIIVSLGYTSVNVMTWVSLSTLFMNFVVSYLILFGCRSMMNGREIKSE